MATIDTSEERPELAGRMSHCSKGCKDIPSEQAWRQYRGFFEYRGEGSRDATDICGVCRYSTVAHDPTAEHMARVEGKDGKTRYEHLMDRVGWHEFTPQGAQPLDSHYDGCRGWD
jgi:hypothetical protein